MYKNHKVIAIVLAAGEGSRFDSKEPKQFKTYNGRPLYVYTLNRLQYNALVDEICIVYPKGYSDRVGRDMEVHLMDKVLYHVEGAGTRNESFYNGLMEVKRHNPSLPDDTIIIDHDADRPFVTSDLICRGVAAAAECGTAWPARKMVNFVGVPDDDGLWGYDKDLCETCTPHFVKYDILKEAYKGTKYIPYFISCMQMLEKTRLIKADTWSLFKVTYPEDWDIFCAIQAANNKAR